MNVIGIIPSRWASSRFPGKSLALLCGKPLIQRVVERCRQAKRLDEIYVATDDDRIREVVERIGAKAIMTRSDHVSGTDRVAEAAKLLGIDAGCVMNIQGDEPLINPALIDRLVEVIVSESDWDMVTAASPLYSVDDAENRALCKVVFAADGQALYFSRSIIPWDVRPDCDQPFRWRHIGIYLYQTRFLFKLVAEPPCQLELAEKLEQLRALHIGGRIKVLLEEEAARGVDLPEDVAVIEQEIKSMGLE